MARLLFEKTGKAVWISHLDLMRLFQRAFKRAGLPLKHTQGFNPRPSVSIALPLSVGTASHCELLDFDLDCDYAEVDNLVERLNCALVDGIKVHRVYHDGRKIRDLSLMRTQITLEYDSGVPTEATHLLTALLSQEKLLVLKKTKSGTQEQDLIPMILNFNVFQKDDHQILIDVLHCCQNPTLNPMQIPIAIQKYLPDCAPDFSRCCRIEIYDSKEEVFR